MDNPRLKVCFAHPNRYAYGYTQIPGPELGLFRLRGVNANLPYQNHQFILSDIQDTGHRLLVHVFYQGRERLVIENASDPASGATFSFKHAGATKKSFKVGEIITPPETSLITWMAPNSEGVKSLVTLTLFPLFGIRGLAIFYTVEPKN